jgi:MoaA/NifB/PqqE/SkfB family radical SAM enzyme
MIREINVLHLESTDVCQAACPQCPREDAGLFDKRSNNHLSFEQVLTHFSIEQIKQLKRLLLCGNFGDPAAGRHTLDILKQTKQINPLCSLSINTNGAIRSPSWWAELADILSYETDYVTFSIDGLADTNHIYRRNVNWNKLIDNVQTFINAGGNARWDMLIYKHNEHQVEDCIELARSLGFAQFRAKVSTRALVPGLEYPTGWVPPASEPGHIDCLSLRGKKAYIDAKGDLFPCCFFGIFGVHKTIDDVAPSWTSDSPEKTCSIVCSVNKLCNKTKPEIELQYEVNFR